MVVPSWAIGFMIELSKLIYKLYEPDSDIKPNKLLDNRTWAYYNESSDYLIDTPGCSIPNYKKTLIYQEAAYLNKTCQDRAVFINKTSDGYINFIIDSNVMENYTPDVRNVSCCYSFIKRSNLDSDMDSKITYSRCIPFRNQTLATLDEEVIKIMCHINKDIIYEDTFMVLKKKKNPKKIRNSFNVLLIGIDTMSPARAYNSMPHTVAYLKEHGWLDYKAYQKVATNTFPNVMSVLTGKNSSTFNESCTPNMDNCRNIMIWNKFKEAGYVTAYGEDNLGLPDTFSDYGFKIPPTDHYMRPLFLAGESGVGNYVCAYSQPSANKVLSYALDFARTYEKEKYFGLFWINSYSHNKRNTPLLLDENIKEFLNNLRHTEAANKTFVILFSDHGMRFGLKRFTVESYYEERLPMLFIWAPLHFRTRFKSQYLNLQINQGRLNSHYDFHMTLWDILKISNKSTKIIKSEACPLCKGFFKEIFPERTCEQAGIDEKWCACHTLTKADKKAKNTQTSLSVALSYVQDKVRTIKTIPCTKCSHLTLKLLLRAHYYVDIRKDVTYYVIAFLTQPGDAAFETKIKKEHEVYTVVQPIDTITEYNKRGYCVRNKSVRPFCVCIEIEDCDISNKTILIYKSVLIYIKNLIVTHYLK